MNLAKKPEPNLPKLLLKILKPISETWLCQEKRKPWKMDFAKWNRLLAKTWFENLEADFRNLSKFEAKLFEPKPWADFEETKIWEIATAKNTRLYWSRDFSKNQNFDLEDSTSIYKPTYFWEANLKI